MNNDQIINRIKKLLTLAEDKANMEESHSAFLTAQKLMVKYGVDPKEITDDEEVKEVLQKGNGDYKRLFWWEKRLAQIISKNFRCKNYIHSTHVSGRNQMQRKIVFMGLEQDVELANAMNKLVIDAIQFYANRYIKLNHITGNRAYTTQAKNDYMKGFIDGLKDKFDEQLSNQEWGLVLVIPKEVEDKFEEVVTGKGIPLKVPKTNSYHNFQSGYEDGYRIDYKKETIGEESLL